MFALGQNSGSPCAPLCLFWNLKLATVIHFIFQFYISPKLASIGLGMVSLIASAVVKYGRYRRSIMKQILDYLAKSTQVTDLTKMEPMTIMQRNAMIIVVQVFPEYVIKKNNNKSGIVHKPP